MLALAGSGEFLNGMRVVDDALIHRLPAPVKVVCLPTAAGLEGSAVVKYWSDLGVSYFTQLGVEAIALPVIDHSSAQDDGFAQTILEANFIYLSGGKPSHLHQSLAGTPVWSAILAVFQRGGLVAGCSAGAMVMGEKYFFPPRWRNGFGVLPKISIIPHFDELPSIYVNLIKRWNPDSLTIIGIDRDTILLQSDHQYEVLGSGQVTIIKDRRATHYQAGRIPQSAL